MTNTDTITKDDIEQTRRMLQRRLDAITAIAGDHELFQVLRIPSAVNFAHLASAYRSQLESLEQGDGEGVPPGASTCY